MADAYRGLANYRAAKTSGSMRLVASVVGPSISIASWKCRSSMPSVLQARACDEECRASAALLCNDPVKTCSCSNGEGSNEFDDGRRH